MHGQDHFRLGPIAYPNLIGSRPCEKSFTVEEAEKGARCFRPATRSSVRWHRCCCSRWSELSRFRLLCLLKAWQHLQLLCIALARLRLVTGTKRILGQLSNALSEASFPEGIFSKELTQMETVARIQRLIPGIKRMSKQYFWGGDRSGAALHYHVAAFNVLFVGEKEWYVPRAQKCHRSRNNPYPGSLVRSEGAWRPEGKLAEPLAWPRTPPYLAARSGIATYDLFHRCPVFAHACLRLVLRLLGHLDSCKAGRIYGARLPAPWLRGCLFFASGCQVLL